MHNTDLSAFLMYGQNDEKTFIFSMRQKGFPNDLTHIIYKDYPAGEKAFQLADSSGYVKVSGCYISFPPAIHLVPVTE